MSTCLLPAIREKCQSSFNLLEIPEILRIDECAGQYGTVFLREYDGQKFDDKWSERMDCVQWGGKALGTELSSEMVQLIQDFRKINIDWLTQHPVGRRIREVAFDLQKWLTSFRDHWPAALNWGISQVDLERAEGLVKEGFRSTDLVFSNGDFYPRNLIRMQQRMVVDWAYWPGNRACFIDNLPNVIAFAFIHMWHNGGWQKIFLTHARNTLGVSPEDIRKAVMIKAFEQAWYWKDLPSLLPTQIQQFRMALEDQLPLQ